jgi:hypothetical protein
MRALAVAGIVALATSACPAGLFPNGPPLLPPSRIDVTALAGPDLEVLEGSRVVLSGSASRALGGDPGLSWAQTAGPPVLLSNPSSPLPVFVAPLAPATLTFQLTANADKASAVDSVTINVSSTPSAQPIFLVVPPDVTASPSSEHTFSVDAAGASIADVALTATASCDVGAAVSVHGNQVHVTLPGTLPCIVIVDGTDKNGRGVAPAATVFWPADAVLPTATKASLHAIVVDDHGSHDKGATPQIDPSIPSTKGSYKLEVGDDGSGAVTRSWSADGNADIEVGGSSGDTDFPTPHRAGVIVVASERRLGGGSGGVRYLQLDVTQGEHANGTPNNAPVARGGDDRLVEPGAHFQIDTSQSSDGDGDPLTITVTEVLGPAATPDPSGVVGLFTAPSADVLSGDVTLLFHVVADDGVVASAPDPVRVLVSSSTPNQPPTLALPPSRFVVPQQAFVLDGSGAQDDSGHIASITISESPDDASILIPTPLNQTRVQLTAGDAGSVYHFQIAAFDDEGLGFTADQTVTVEDAGPFVDPARGDDATGNGTAASPFATIAAALPTAVRHELPELLLAEGTHAAIAGALPSGLSLRGGQHFDAASASYLDDGLPTVLPVDASASIDTTTGLGVDGAHLASIIVHLAANAGSVTLDGSSALDTVTIDEDAAHAAPLVVVGANPRIDGEQATSTVTGSTISPASPHDDASVVLSPAAAMTLSSSLVLGAPTAAGDATAVAIGVHCTGATLALDGANVTGGAGAATSIGVRAEQDCVLDATASTVTGGDGGTCTGIAADDALITLDDRTAVIGASGNATAATAFSYSGLKHSALVGGTLAAGGDGVNVDAAVALDVADASVRLQGASVSAIGASLASAVRMAGGVLVCNDANIAGKIVGVDLGDPVDAQIVDSTITAPTGINASGAGSVTLDVSDPTQSVTVTSTLAGIAASGVDVSLGHAKVSVAGAGAVSGVAARSLGIADSTIAVSGNDVVVLALQAGDAIVQRTTLKATSAGGACTAASTSAGALTLDSTFVTVSGGVAGCAAIDASGAVTLRQATIVSDQIAVKTEVNATLDAANSIVDGNPAIAAAKTPVWTRGDVLAFNTGSTFVVAPGVTATALSDLASAAVGGCSSCLVVDVSVPPGNLVQPDGHLTPGDNALVDAADPALSLPDDIDGDSRPQGPLPDVGCDERVGP